ncbi:hypothetical protein J2X01_000105 [Arthrobacter ginsengisoli]|uniref:YhcG PDDEXK nuclease domain-containing protein n=1 Tax=Arthrobacter ginsengisoli TaxID=1356565 RepID=A0ABU1U6S0_9MICC|nr:PDDEXK nuclease domain-containing protein [Arthrobacter ginsengisoli]MDR7080836.1 hypothetical protein [Arthrobacter ginsengisoli]
MERASKLQPEYAGKLNFYVTLVDDVLRRQRHNETVGILICGNNTDPSVRYSLGRSTRSVAGSTFPHDGRRPADGVLSSRRADATKTRPCSPF